MDIETEEKHSEIIYRLLEYYPLFEKAIENGDIWDEVRNCLVKDLNDCYSTLKEPTEDIYHVSHVLGEIICYSHSYCNQKIKKNYFKIPVVAHNLFRLNFFFLLKGLIAGLWRTKNIKIGGKNPRDRNFVNIGNQFNFLTDLNIFSKAWVL